MAVGDPAVASFVPQAGPGEAVATVRYAAGILSALLVLAVGLLLKRRHADANAV